MVHEAIHTIKLKNHRAMIVQMNLIQANDQVNCDFLRLLILHSGLD